MVGVKSAGGLVRVGLVTVVLLLAGGTVPAAASGPEAVVIDLQTVIGSGEGTFQASGAFEDEGNFVFINAFSTAFPSPEVLTVHAFVEFQGIEGTFTARLQTLLTPSPSCVWPDHGRWVITSGTGAYEGLRGTGVHDSSFNVCAGQAPAVWEGSVHSHG